MNEDKEDKNNIDNEEKEDKEDKEKIGLYLNIIINQEEKDHNLFNYKNNIKIKNIFTFIDESIYLVLTQDDDIIKIYQHSEIESEKRKEQIILAIKKDDNSFIYKILCQV